MFILNSEPQPDGFTVSQVDVTVAQRINLVTFTDTHHETVAIPVDTLLANTLAPTRAPTNRRGNQ